jgi:hypothetical protein
MDCYLIPSHNTRMMLKVAITSATPVNLVIKGFNPDKPNSIYFEREVDFFKNAKEFDIPMPTTPFNLKVCAYQKENKQASGIKINYLRAESLGQGFPQYNTLRDQEFYDFIEWFSQNCGFLKPDKIYESKNKNFEIKLSRQVLNDNGSLSSTPARTFRPGGEIEVSQEQFNKMTVYMRMMILLHEYFHIRANTTNEEIADKYAMQTFAAMGYPKTEALYSFIKVFKPQSEKHERALLERTDKLNNFLKFS